MITRDRAAEILNDIEEKMQAVFDDEDNEYTYQADFWQVWEHVVDQYYPDIEITDVDIEGYKYNTIDGYYFKLAEEDDE
jgi:ATP-dependent helicase YprA (DUF1998 family)